MGMYIFCIWISLNIVTDATINTIAESETEKNVLMTAIQNRDKDGVKWTNNPNYFHYHGDR